jgi:hypothetical protein
MKTYKIEIIIQEGNDHFWNDISTRNVTGCDEVLEAVKMQLSEVGWDEESGVEFRLSEFTNK